MKRKALRFLTLALLVLAVGAKAHAGTCPAGVPAGITNCFFVSFTHGSDSNSGTTEASPWQHAPGMQGCTSNCNTNPAPGTGFIFQGCVTWPNSVFEWKPKGGSSAGYVYYGVDKTWQDSAVAGCSTSWNRPIMDLQGQPSNNSPLQDIFALNGGNNYIILDNFEVKNVLDMDSQLNGENETHIFDVGANQIIENMYVHGWKSQFFAIGKGNLTAGSSTVTNFVPLSYSPMAPASNWPSLSSHIIVGDVSGHNIPQTGNGSVLTGVSGSNPYTITWTNSTASANCTGCIITVGGDFLKVFAGNETGNANVIAQLNVIDGSDSTAASINPSGDCGLSEGNNNWCGTSGVAQWRGPQIWRNNVIRYVQSGAVGACTEWSGNLVEYIRFSANASAHTNLVECLDEIPANGITLQYNNVYRHTNNANPNLPGGRQSIGWFTDFVPPAGATSYAFNNVVYDTLQNAWFQVGAGTTGCQSGCGAIVAFNNSSDSGPSWDHSFSPANSCTSRFSSCTFKNNYWVTNASSEFSGGACGSNCTISNERMQTVAAATAAGYSENQSFAFMPVAANSPTVGTGVSTASFCAAISQANAAAGTACQTDTSYAVSYDATAHTVVLPGRSMTSRVSSTLNTGAYQYSTTSSGGTPPAAPQSLTAVVN